MTESLKAGWMRGMFLAVEGAVGTNRWLWWLEAVDEGKAEDIPQVEFSGGSAVTKGAEHMTDMCLRMHKRPIDLIEWILWSLGDPIWGRNYPQGIDEKTHRFWYQNFDIGLLLRDHTDHISWFLAEMTSKMSSQATGYFPTPPSIATLLSELVMGDLLDINESVHEPAVGCGAMLLPVSNKSINLSGMDVAYQCVLGCTLNAWLFVPWLIPCNGTVNGMDWRQPRIAWANALTMEIYSYPTDGWDAKPAPARPTATESELKEIRKKQRERWENHPAIKRVAKDVVGYIGFRKELAKITDGLENLGNASD